MMLYDVCRPYIVHCVCRCIYRSVLSVPSPSCKPLKTIAPQWPRVGDTDTSSIRVYPPDTIQAGTACVEAVLVMPQQTHGANRSTEATGGAAA